MTKRPEPNTVDDWLEEALYYERIICDMDVFDPARSYMMQQRQWCLGQAVFLEQKGEAHAPR